MLISGYVENSFNDSINMLDIDGPIMRYPLGNEDKMKYGVSKAVVGTLNFILGWAVVTPIVGALHLVQSGFYLVFAVVSLPFLLLAKIFDFFMWARSNIDDSYEYKVCSRPFSKFTQKSLGLAAGGLACVFYSLLNFVTFSALNRTIYSE